jgi:serine protease Do
MTRKTYSALTLAVLALFGVGMLVFDLEAAPPADTPPITKTPEMADQLSAAFEKVAEVVRPSVVSITSVRRAQATTNPFGGSPFGDSPFGDFFDRFLGPQGPGGGQGFLQQGLGTGFVLTRDGYIVTNHHVVANAEELEVRSFDDRTYRAEVVGTDASTDVAVLKIDTDGKGLEPVVLGSSGDLRVGQWVVAVGSPFGLSSTITAGIVSAKGRSGVGISDYEDFIQTDAAINPGNSGGPLVNLHGEVVGINTAIFSRSGGYMGIGFAIPVDLARNIVDSLVETGRVVRGFLGVGIQDLTQELAQSFGYDSTQGALIGDVTENSPAGRAGLKQGDIIVRFDGKEIEDVAELRLMVAATKPGTEADVVVFRNGKRRTLEVEIGELETEDAPIVGEESSPDRLGMSLHTLTPEIARSLGVDEGVRGAVITEVEPLSAAARAGLRPRDVIVAVGDEPVRDTGDLQQLLADADLEEGVRLRVMTGNMQRFVFLRSE